MEPSHFVSIAESVLSAYGEWMYFCFPFSLFSVSVQVTHWNNAWFWHYCNLCFDFRPKRRNKYTVASTEDRASQWKNIRVLNTCTHKYVCERGSNDFWCNHEHMLACHLMPKDQHFHTTSTRTGSYANADNMRTCMDNGFEFFWWEERQSSNNTDFCIYFVARKVEFFFLMNHSGWAYKFSSELGGWATKLNQTNKIIFN